METEFDPKFFDEIVAIKALDYLSSLNSNEIIIKKTNEALYYIRRNLLRIRTELFFEKKLHDFLSKILLELYNVKKDLKLDSNKFDVSQINTENELKISLMYLTVLTVNIISLTSIQFDLKFCQNGLEAHFLFLKDDDFIRQTIDLMITDHGEFEYNLIESLLLNISVFVRNCEDNMAKWLELDAVNTLLKVAKLRQRFELYAYGTVTSIVNDKQIESLSDMHGIVSLTNDKLKKIADDFRSNKFKREARQVTEGDKLVDVYIHCINHNNSSITATYYLSCLYRLAVNDKLRKDIYFRDEFPNNLKDILFKANDFETQFCLRVYAQLSFNSEITSDMSSDLIDFIQGLKQSNDKSIVKLSEQILWNIEQNKPSKSQETTSGEHIMISYNSASRDLCLKLKTRLEEIGYKVWIDVGNIHGSSLDAMAKAVEDAFCVLMCVTEKYRTSINCQAEAMYAFRLNKPIIPLIMQKGFENVQGWLGILLGDKIFINFCKYEYSECTKRLEHELTNIRAKLPVVSKPVEKLPQNDTVETWDELRVKEWFELNKLSMKIYGYFSVCNGSILQQLFEMRRDAPEFYYQSFRTYEGVNFESILKFTECLKKLYDKK